MAAENKVWFVFGSSPEYFTVDNIQAFEFDTLAELNAFLWGIDVGVGWLSSMQFDSYEEAVTHCESIAYTSRFRETDASDD